MAHELLDGGEVGAGVEEITGVGAAKIVGGDGGRPVARARRVRT